MPVDDQKFVPTSADAAAARDSVHAMSIEAETVRGRQADSARPDLRLALAPRRATIALGWQQRGFVDFFRIMADQFGLRLDDACDATVADIRKQPAELVDDFVGVEPDRPGVVTHEGARENAGGPFRKVILFEARPEVRADLGDGDDGTERDAAALTFAAEPGTEGIVFRHGGSCARSKFHADRMSSKTSMFPPSVQFVHRHFCNRHPNSESGLLVWADPPLRLLHSIDMIRTCPRSVSRCMPATRADIQARAAGRGPWPPNRGSCTSCHPGT